MTHTLGRLKTIRAFSTSNAVEGLKSYTNAAGNTVFEGMPVFKAGTFKDSMGYQNTWDPEHLEQMVFNFTMLRDRGILPNVPVRDGHRSLFSGGEVIGYLVGLTHEQSTGRLLADYEITEPAAAEKIKRGTFRARSAEIGMYETNDEATYWPVFQGFAFVDIPAVEGLYSKASDNEFVILTEKEPTVADDKKDDKGTGAPAVPATPGTPGTEPAATEPAATAPGENQPGDGAVVPAVPVAEHAAAATGTQAFSINGTPTTDFAAVQSHITALETAATEQRDAGRRMYVSQLASDKKITQPQVEGLTSVALTMDDTQFAAFRAAYDVAPEQPLLAVHAGSGGGAEHSAAQAAEQDEKVTLEETVAQHRRAGVPQAQIEKMPSFIRLQALQGQTPKE